jgi:hypothetical protein
VNSNSKTAVELAFAIASLAEFYENGIGWWSLAGGKTASMNGQSTNIIDNVVRQPSRTQNNKS